MKNIEIIDVRMFSEYLFEILRPLCGDYFDASRIKCLELFHQELDIQNELIFKLGGKPLWVSW